MASRPSPYSAEQVEEIRRFNADLTQAGQKQRPGRDLNGRDRGGGGFGTNSSRPATGGNTTGSVSGSTMSFNHQFTRPGALVRGDQSQVQSRNSYASPISMANPRASAALMNNSRPPSTSDIDTYSQAAPAPPTNPLQAAPASSVSSCSPSSRLATAPAANPFQAIATSLAPVTSAAFGLSGQPQGFGSCSVGLSSTGDTTSVAQKGFAAQPQSAASTPANVQQNGIQTPFAPVGSGRQLIVTNWGPDPVGPIIPSHLRQPDASVAIMEIAQMTGMRYEDLTSDGMSIPAARPHAASLQQPSIPHALVRGAPSDDRIQTNVEPTTSIESASKLRRHQVSTMEMNDDMEVDDAETPSAEHPRLTGNLQDSQWAFTSAAPQSTYEQRWDLPVKRQAPSEYASTFHAPVSVPVPPPYWNPARANANENARSIPTLKDSKWATPSVNTHPSLTQPRGPLQPVNSRNSNGFSVPTPVVSSCQGNDSFSPNSIGQATAATGFTFSAPADPFPTKWRTPRDPSSSPFIFGQTSQKPDSFAPPTTAIPGLALAVPQTSKPATIPVPKVEKEKTLKDSMWAS